MSNEPVVINFGGSIFNPGEIDVPLVLKFREIILNQIEEHGRRFFIIVGGGRPARTYRDKAKEAGITDSDSLDMIGIGATRLNAIWMNELFRPHTDKSIFMDPAKVEDLGENITFAGGLYPGASSDHATLLFAQAIGVKKIILMGSAPHVYNKDFNAHEDAVPYDNLTWDEYLEISGTEWTPGMNVPIDPIAAQLGQKEGMEVTVIGSDIDNLRRCMEGEDFEGTVIA